jgi:exosome complex component RRP4
MNGEGDRMKDLIKKERDLVLPGDRIVESMDYLPGRNAFREGDAIYSKRLGVMSLHGRVISVIPLSGPYVPRIGDMVIGEVVDIQPNGWILDISAIHESYLPLSGVREFIDTTKTDLAKIYAVGDALYAKVAVSNGKSIHLSMQDSRARKFRGGRILRISAVKVPRLIGKEGSMITMIKDRTGCRINVGQNGTVWVEGERTDLVKKAIDLIETKPHSDGLTDKVSDLLEKATKPSKKDEKPAPKEEPKKPEEKETKKPEKEAKKTEAKDKGEIS